MHLFCPSHHSTVFEHLPFVPPSHSKQTTIKATQQQLIVITRATNTTNIATTTTIITRATKTTTKIITTTNITKPTKTTTATQWP